MCIMDVSEGEGMTVTVTELSREALVERRQRLLDDVHMSEEALRVRVRAEAATADERATLATLNEIAFLLDDQ